MALANLTINLTANSAPAKQGLQEVGAQARTSMKDSGDAVDDFRARLLRAADDLQVAARQMGSGFEAANDSMVADTKRTQDAVDALVDHVENVKLDTMQERVAAAFGTAFGAGYLAAQTWLDKMEEAVKVKAQIIGIGMALAIISATAAAVYTAYKVISATYGFVKGLFTGESYKSENIDALIEVNKEVKTLADRLYVSQQYASALRDALGRLGVNKDDYIAVQEGATKAMRANGDELDRLGVKYKDANGKFLQTEDFLQNVKAALDDYTEGYDRNAAAAAIGVGSYAQVVEALKVTQKEIVDSKERLDEYGLAIGPKTAAYVDQYQKAMREFQHELDLTSMGFKRAIADNIMPILTDLAEFFRDGFPTAVRVFRYTMAEVTSLFYGIKTATYIVAESVLGLIESMGLGISGVGSALIKVFQGDFSGAKDELFKGWEAAKQRFGQIGDNIVTQALRNRDAIIQAWGLDDRTDMPTGPRSPSGKKWTPAPTPAPVTPEVKSPYKSFIEELDRMIAKVNEGEYAMLRFKAQQLAAKEGITDLTAAYNKINEIQRGESQKAVDEYTRRLKDENDMLQFQGDILGYTTREQEKFTFARQKTLEVERQIDQARRSGKPLDDKAMQDLRDAAQKAIQDHNSGSDANYAASRTSDAGYQKALHDYLESATDTATQVRNVISDGLKGMEDAMVKFVRTGKLNFSSLADSVLNSMARMFVQQHITAPLAEFLGLKGVQSVLGFAGGGDPPVGVASMVGENGPELFVPKQAGTVIPNHMLNSVGGGGNLTVVNQITLGNVATMDQVDQQLRASERRTQAAFMRARTYGGIGS